MKNYVKLMRVHHYIKNLLVLAALACSGQMMNGKKLMDGILAFLSFCFVSSFVYIVNDIRDRDRDRLHPVKCRRPIAAGTVPVRGAWILAGTLLILALLCNGLVFRQASTGFLITYVVLNLGYSLGLKNYPMVDITILAAGFIIRMAYGAMITEISISSWLYLTVIALSFYFSLGKRRNELRNHGEAETRQVLKAYPISFLDKSMEMCMTLANVFYALWSTDEKTKAFYETDYLIFTVPIVLLITMKYSLNVERQSEGDPVEVLLHDRVLLALTALYLAAMFLILYF